MEKTKIQSRSDAKGAVENKVVDRLFEENKDRVLKAYYSKMRWEKFNSFTDMAFIVCITFLACNYIFATTDRAKWEGRLFKARYIAQSINNQIGMEKIAEFCNSGEAERNDNDK